MPTVLALKEIPFAPTAFDGVSLIDVLQQRESSELPGYAETYYPEEIPQNEGNGEGNGNVTSCKKAFWLHNHHKLIVHLNSNQYEYYDLTADPYELNNLALFAKGVDLPK